MQQTLLFKQHVQGTQTLALGSTVPFMRMRQSSVMCGWCAMQDDVTPWGAPAESEVAAVLQRARDAARAAAQAGPSGAGGRPWCSAVRVQPFHTILCLKSQWAAGCWLVCGSAGEATFPTVFCPASSSDDLLACLHCSW